MEKIIDFKDIRKYFLKYGDPSCIVINPKEDDIFEQTCPCGYRTVPLARFYSHGNIGYLGDTPVLSGVIGKRKAKLVWQ